MKIPALLLTAITVAWPLSLGAAPETKAVLDCSISETGIGPIRLGMTLRQAKAAMPAADFQRTSDGDGAVLVSVVLGKDNVMVIAANEPDADKPIDWSKKIDFLETFNPSCKTRDGIFVGMPVLEAEKKLGKTKEILESEIESRQYITFQKEPANLLFRIDYSGIFAEGSRSTKKFKQDARIFSIAVFPR